MLRNRALPLVAAMLALSLVLMGCGLVSPAVRLFKETSPTPRPAVVEQIVVATPDTIRADQAGSGQSPATVQISLAPGADPETDILRAVYQKVNGSVVYIVNLTRLGDSRTDATLPESQGSGFVWDNLGHIVTNHHVVEGADAMTVTFSDGVEVPAEVLGSDPDSDLAVIKVDPSLVTLTPVEQGNINEVQVGQRAIAIGNPFGLVGTMTSGIVSAIGRSVESITGYSIPLSIQTDAAINPGNSGGPLLNERGQVIGVNFQIRSDSRSNSGVGFAIPINIVQRVAPAIIDHGKYTHAWLGMSGQTYSPAWAAALGFPAAARGAYVMGLVDGGPVADAGLRAGNTDSDIVLGVGPSGPVYLQRGGDLVVSIDDHTVRTFDDVLVYLESEKSPGERVVLSVLRSSGGEAELEVTLGERPRQRP